MEAYMHGIVITCCDGILRRFYPRIFIYAADYPEKWVVVVVTLWKFLLKSKRVVLATVRNLGGCPCPRCLIPLERVHNLGMKNDRKQRKTLARIDNQHRRDLIEDARKIIYDLNRPVSCKKVENILKEHSYVPTEVHNLISLVGLSMTC